MNTDTHQSCAYSFDGITMNYFEGSSDTQMGLKQYWRD